MIGRTNSEGWGEADKSQIFVTAPSGSIVTCSNNLITKEAEEKNGQWRFKNLDLGDWTITAIRGNRDRSQQVKLDRLSITYRTLEYFDAYITVFSEEGATCTCKKGEVSVQGEYQGSGKFIFNIRDPGRWEITASKGSVTKTTSIQIQQDLQREEIYVTFSQILLSQTIRPKVEIWQFSNQIKDTDPFNPMPEYPNTMYVKDSGGATLVYYIDDKIDTNTYTKLTINYWNRMTNSNNIGRFSLRANFSKDKKDKDFTIYGSDLEYRIDATTESTTTTSINLKQPNFSGYLSLYIRSNYPYRGSVSIIGITLS